VTAPTSGRVLVTGAHGSVGTALISRLVRIGWTVRGLDLAAPKDDLLIESVQADAFDPIVLDECMLDCVAVVHLAAPPHEDTIDVIARTHIAGTARILEAASRAGITRVVIASSNPAIGCTPRGPMVDISVRPRPDTYYGVGKVAAEALASLYVDRMGMQMACLRIGSFMDRPVARRHLSTWLSPDDLGRLVDACLRSDELGFAVVFGISANTRGWWDLEPGRRIGYHPQDDAEEFAADILANTPEPAPDDPEEAFLGGPFAGAGQPIGQRR
jgi:uronate dehydrogenase